MSATALLTTLLAASITSQAAPDVLTVDSVLLTPVEEAELAARKAGAVTKVGIRRGQTVEADHLLVQIDDADAEVAREQALIELEVAREEAGNDVTVRHAKKTLAVAQAELKRAEVAVRKFRQSVSDGEMDRLRLTVERDTLAVEQSEHDHRITQAGLRLKENAMRLAELEVAQRKVVAPFAGIVAEVTRSRGEWVKPGDAVARLLRIDRLRAEAFIDARYANANLLQRAATLVVVQADGTQAEFSGEVVFVSPEIDPVDGQLLIWAEADNPNLALRPGQRATLTIDVSSPAPPTQAKVVR